MSSADEGDDPTTKTKTSGDASQHHLKSGRYHLRARDNNKNALVSAIFTTCTATSGKRELTLTKWLPATRYRKTAVVQHNETPPLANDLPRKCECPVMRLAEDERRDRCFKRGRLRNRVGNAIRSRLLETTQHHAVNRVNVALRNQPLLCLSNAHSMICRQGGSTF